MPRKNPLLCRPPKGVHGLGVAAGRRAQQVLGRPVTDADYEGVHTTSSLEIAASYAIATADKARVEHDEDAYPVVLALDVSGLEALPDIDALVEAADMLGDKGIRRQYEGEDLDYAMSGDTEQYESSMEIGNTVAYTVFQQRGFIPAAFDDDDDAFQHWVNYGEYPPWVAINLVNQKRYMTDIGIDRLVSVLAVQPWYEEILGFYDDEDEAEKIEAIEAQGYAVVTIEDQEIEAKTKEVARGPAPNTNVEYHGTSSWHAMRAFPELQLPPNPFPITEREDNPRHRALAARLARGG